MPYDLIQRNTFLLAISPCLHTPQYRHTSAAAQRRADIVAERSDIGTLGAADINDRLVG